MKGKFKGFCCLALAFIMALSVPFYACGGGGENNNENNDDKEEDKNIVDNGKKDQEQSAIVTPENQVTTTKLKVYDGPSIMTSSQKLNAYVDDTQLFVYDTRVNHNRSFTYSYSQDTAQVVSFDFEGKVHMKVEVSDTTSLKDVVIRPLAYDIQPTVNGNTIEFDLQYSANYILEYNLGDAKDGSDAADNALHIFANPMEENPIDADNVPDDVIYIGPGVYSAGAIPMTSGKTIYLAGGAYVYGQVRAEQLQDIKICGRGIFSGTIYDRTRASEYTLPIELRSCSNVTIEGIAILDPAGWAITLYKCENVTLNNVKIITARANGDGISVQSCSNVNVNGGFVRTWDDSLVVKNSDRGVTKNVTFDGVVVWTDLAQSCEVGYETYGATMDDINFKNITIVHNYHKAAMSIHNCDDANITNVNYKNITIEDARMLGDNQNDGENDYLIDITIAFNTEWTKSEGVRGTINGVTFDNINVISMADTIVSRISGESTTSYVENVNISNVQIEGKKIKSAEELKLGSNVYTKAIIVNEGSSSVIGAQIKLPYKLALADSNVAKVIVPTKSQNGLEVPDFSMLDITENYMGVKLNVSGASFVATHGVGSRINSPYDDGTGNFETENNTINNAFDGDRSTAWIAKDWTGTADEFAAVTIDFGKEVAPGVIRVYLAEDSSYVYDFTIGVFTKRTAEATNFVRSVSTTTYSSSPASGNYFDIKLSSSLTCYSLQLRIYRTSGVTSPKVLSLSEISFYPSSLSTSKAITSSSEHNDVYVADYLTDGLESTYWEAKIADGAYFVVDLGDVYSVQYVVMHLPPLLTWEPRTQVITIYVSTDGQTWQTFADETSYLFDPSTGNSNTVKSQEGVRARYVKLVWSSNSSLGGYGAQLSELYVYGE